MQYCKKFCRVFNITLVVFITIMYFILKCYNFFYPGYMNHIGTDRLDITKNIADERILTVNEMKVEKVLGSTKLLIHMVDESTGFSFDYECPMQAKYVGMDREQFCQALITYENCPPLKEREQGFEEIELVQFSEEYVTIKKFYKNFSKVSLIYDDL